MTPNDLEILIHYYVSNEPHPRLNAPAVQHSIEKFVLDGIFKLYVIGNKTRITEKGKAWLKTILSVPYPQKVWVDENGDVIFHYIRYQRR